MVYKNFPFFPENPYRDGWNDKIVYEWTDHSRDFRMGYRAGWSAGEQLWDGDVNAAWDWRNRFWNASYVHWRRDHLGNRPPWYEGPVFFSIYREYESGHAYIKDNDTHVDFGGNTMEMRFPATTYPIKPEPGNISYVLADRMVVAFTGTAWKPLFRMPELDMNIEIAVFADTPKKGEAIMSMIVSQPFVIKADGIGSRVRNWNRTVPIPILKNDVEVGYAFQIPGIVTGIRMTSDTEFQAGDKLTLMCPNVYGVPQGVSITIMGGLL